MSIALPDGATPVDAAKTIDALGIGEPTQQGLARCDGRMLRFRRWGIGKPAILLMPAWCISNSDLWLPLVPLLLAEFSVIAFDGCGNGGSTRSADPADYTATACARDAVAVLDECGVGAANVVGLSYGGHAAALLSARHPDRVLRTVLIAPSSPFGPANPEMSAERFTRPRPADAAGWDLFNREAMVSDYARFAGFFIDQALAPETDPALHADAMRQAAATDGGTLVTSLIGRRKSEAQEGEDVYEQIRRPLALLHGTEDRICPFEKSVHIARLLGCPLVPLPGLGHLPPVTHPDRTACVLAGFFSSND